MDKIDLAQIDPVEAVYAVSETLRRIDIRLMDHGERVGYMGCRINEYGKLGLDEKRLFLLSVFHDIGAYKTEEIDRMLEFESQDVESHSIYGYLFLKHMSPLKDYAEAILYHHAQWADLEKTNSPFKDYASLIHLTDRIDVAMGSVNTKEEVVELIKPQRAKYKPEIFDCALATLEETSLYEDMQTKDIHQENLKRSHTMNISAEAALEFLKMIVYSIDFRSENTVTHTINTISLALNIAHHFELEEDMYLKIYIGALLHDVGKIAIPISILEYPSRLSAEQMAIMRTHVAETKKIIDKIVPEDICALALGHHEKLDGSGYPLGLKGKEITFPQRIIAVADIASALSSRRSYKDPFPKEKTISILREMKKEKLDPKICDYICDNYDSILSSTEKAREAVINQYQAIQKEYKELMERKVTSSC